MFPSSSKGTGGGMVPDLAISKMIITMTTTHITWSGRMISLAILFQSFGVRLTPSPRAIWLVLFKDGWDRGEDR